MVVTVNDLPETDLASNGFGEHECVERERQLMNLSKFVSKFETIRDELIRLAPPSEDNFSTACRCASMSFVFKRIFVVRRHVGSVNVLAIGGLIARAVSGIVVKACLSPFL
jgi:hypothetical protein